MNTDALLERDAAHRLLAAFVPHAGRAYAAERNFDRGPSDRTNVSMLSRYVRHRVVTERDMLAAILAHHSPADAFKSVQEIMWRTYWKGWLEAHPSVWSTYRTDLAACLDRLDTSSDERERYELATSGKTGIEAFDAWVGELTATGYLHNHARMWFASIWMFTLALPWELGADFFMRHLLDGDPASNTLSWRWVAGRQTPGKTYLATRRNILHYTEGRLDPGPHLAHAAPAPRGLPRPPSESRGSIAPSRDVDERALLVLHDDDFGSDSLPCEASSIAGVAALDLSSLRSPGGVAPNVAAFTHRVARQAVDAILTSGDAFDAGAFAATDLHDAARTLVRTARERGLSRVIAPYGNVGPGSDAVDVLRAECAAQGIAFDCIVRPYDTLTWPHTKSGFFSFAKEIPRLLTELGVRPRELQVVAG